MMRIRLSLDLLGVFCLEESFANAVSQKANLESQHGLTTDCKMQDHRCLCL